MAEVEIPPNLMNWRMIVVVGEGGGAAEKRVLFCLFFVVLN